MKGKDIHEMFQTPTAVCEYMVGLVPDGSRRILEPTRGLGNIVNALVRKGKYMVYQPEDFFLLDKTKRFDCVVMNPPFSLPSAKVENAPADVDLNGMRVGYYILEECMKLSDNVIALMPWFTIASSDVRLRKLKAYGMKSLTNLPRKTFDYARIQTTIIELEKGYQGETIFRAFDF
ncbi:hypothetical protein [Lacihabitans soyangensis]|uniref:Uncharacterized protein n=1 Tax=Lacihabitans soyangensis TaxID=869394 RepID=A0AAE3H2F5_9BACT|nr:hypothetical protein [Lacihabitans soyangensis]MCP9763834.1 hypothetical protein [Lacihabitans soyangensis]